jgi:hypothetical protein
MIDPYETHAANLRFMAQALEHMAQRFDNGVFMFRQDSYTLAECMRGLEKIQTLVHEDWEEHCKIMEED